MYKFIKKYKKIFSILLAIGIFINMQYPYINVLADNINGLNTVSTTTGNQMMFGGAGTARGGITFSNFEANIVLQKVLSNAGEDNETTLDLTDKKAFDDAHITLDTPLNIKIDTKIKETIRKDDIIDITLPDYPVDLSTFENNEYTDSGFTYKIQIGFDGKKHIILKCLEDIELTSQPAEYILKLPTKIKVQDHTKTKIEVPFENGTKILTVNIAPKGITSSIQKIGLQELNSIRWFIDINLFSETISNFNIIENIPNEVIFDNNTTVVAKKLNIDLHGNKEITDEIISGVSKSISGNVATITVNKQIDYPIRIEFVTPVKENVVSNSTSSTLIKNMAEFSGTTSEAEVDFKPTDMLEKTHEIVNFNGDKISWKLTLNSAKTVIEDNKIKITEAMSSKKKENNDINSDEYAIDIPTKITIKNIDKNRSIDVVPTGNGNNFEYEFERNDDEKNDTFEITYDTPIKNKISNIQTKSLIENIAKTTLSAKEHSATDTAEIVKSMHIKKSVNGISKTTQGYKSTWKISVNFDKHNIAPVVYDNIGLAPADNIKVLKDTIKVYEVTPKKIEDENHPDYKLWDAPYENERLVSSDKYTVSEITDTTRDFNISFNEQSNKSYVIKYDTLLDAPNDVVNTATLDGKSASAGLGGNTHNRIYKYIRTHSEKKDNNYITVYDDLDMGNKTMLFYIYVEPNRAPMKNIVIDDTFVNKGLSIERGDISFSDTSITDADFTFEKKADATEGFKLSINKEISNKLEIKMVAHFTKNDNISTEKTHFPNKITATWKDKYNGANTNNNQVEYIIPQKLVDESYKNNSNISGTLHGGDIKDRLIDWTTNINYAGEKLPANTSVKIYPIKQDSPDDTTTIDERYHKIIDNFNIYPYKLNKYGDIKYDMDHKLIENTDYTKTYNGDGSYTITFLNPITTGYSIRYSTQIDTKYTDDEKTNTEFDIYNKIKFKLKNEINVPPLTSVNIAAIVDTKIREVFDKTGVQNKLNAYEINYTAIFNQIAEKVPQGTYIYDVLSEDQIFMPNSLIMTYSNGTRVPESDYVVNYSVDSKARHVMSIRFTKDITEPIKISYNAHVNNENAKALKNAISYKEDPTDADVKDGSKITFKRRGSGTLIVPKGGSLINISYTNESCCKNGKCPIFPNELEFEVIIKDSPTSTETLYKTVKVGINTKVPVNISADKFVKVKLKQDSTANPKLREFESNFEKTVADKVTNVKYDVSLNEYKLKIKFEGDIGSRFDDTLAPNISLQYSKNNASYNEKIDAITLKNAIKSLVSPNEYIIDVDTITQDMLKNSTNDKVKLQIPAGDVNLKNYKIELLSINGEPTADKNINNNEIVLNKCAEDVIVVKISRLKKHSITLKQWASVGAGINFTDNTVANNKDIILKATKGELKENTASNDYVLFEDIAEDIYDIIAPAIPYYITPEISTDFISAENSSAPNKVDVSKSSFMTELTATNTDALYKKAKRLIINKKEVIRKYDGTDETKIFNKDITFTLTDKNDSNITAKFTVNSSTQKYKVVEDNSNIIDVQGDVLYVKEGQYTLMEENMHSNYYYGYIDLSDTKNLTSSSANNTSIDVDLRASVTDIDVTKEIYNHRDYNTLKITKTGDDIHPVTGTKIALYTAVNGKEGTKIDEKTVDGSGIVTFDNISDLKYGYKETKAADGYILDSTFYFITRDSDTSGLILGRTETKSLVNNRMKSKIVISKKDVSRDKYLSGVSFILQGTNENSQDVSAVKIQKDTAKIGDIAQASWDNLEVGTYKLYEKIPEGYKTPESYVNFDTVDNHIFTGYRIQINDNKKIYTVDDNNKNKGKIITDEKNATVILNTALTLNFDVKKKSANDDIADKNNLPLKGVQYTLTEKTNSNIVGKFSKTVSTNQNGIATFENIAVGEYELKESATIDPYKKDTAVTTVKVENDNGTAKLIVGTDENTNKLIEKTNSVDYGTLKITKTAGNQKVNNVKFTIKYIADINKVPAGFVNGITAPTNLQSHPYFKDREYKATTATVGVEDGVIKQKLPKGIYKITEVEAPDGYQKSAPYYVKVSGNDAITTQTINNEVETVKLSIVKKDANDNRLIKGAKFEIERKNNINGSYEKLKNTDNTTIFTTNADGKIEVNVQKGDIKITEITTAPHYSQNSLQLYDTVVEDSKKISGELKITADKTVIATNTKIKSKFVLNKKSVTRDGNSANFANVEFKLYETDENYTKLDNVADYTFTTDADGKIEEEINTGYYVIQETRKMGYTANIVVNDNGTPILSNNLSFKKDINADINISVENKPIYVKFKITKVKDGTNDVVQGATVAIFDKNDTKIAEATSGADGVMNFDATYLNGVRKYDGILWQEGLYYKELNRPNGYFLNDKKHNITLADDVSLNDSTISYTLGNKQILGEIKLITYSRNKLTNAEAKLGNIKVELEKYDGINWQKIREATTDTKGEFVFTTLEEGKYRVVEKYADNEEVLKGYEQFNNKTATTTKGGNIKEVEIKPASADGKDTNGVTNHTLYISHEAFFGSLTINKKDTDGNKLTGVEFGLYDDSDKKIDTLITNDGTVKKENIIFGNYYIKEEKTPNNILMDTSKIDLSINYGNRDVVKDIINDKFNATIEVSVVDKETNEPIDNTEISTNTLGKKTTGTTGQISYTNVPKGTHEISISKVNPNYLPNPTVEKVELKDADNNKVVKIVYKLTKIRTGIILTKTDKKTGEKLQGIEFELKGTKVGNTTAIVKTTDEQGKIIFDNLIYDTYTIKETQTKEEYRLLEDAITVELNQENLELNVKNTKKTGLLEFVTVDKNSRQPLRNAHIEIYKENKKIATFVTNEDGRAENIDTKDKNIYIVKDQVTNKNQIVMPIGKYTIKEIKAPNGYELNKESMEFEISLDTAMPVTLENEPRPSSSDDEINGGNSGGFGGGVGGNSGGIRDGGGGSSQSVPGIIFSLSDTSKNTTKLNIPKNPIKSNIPENLTLNTFANTAPIQIDIPNENSTQKKEDNLKQIYNASKTPNGQMPVNIKPDKPATNTDNNRHEQSNNTAPDGATKPNSTTTDNTKDKSNVEKIKKAIESKNVYEIVDKQNRRIGTARVLLKDNGVFLEFVNDSDVPLSGKIKYDEDDNSIELIEDNTPLSQINFENKTLPKTGSNSNTTTTTTISGFALILLAMLLKRKNKNI